MLHEARRCRVRFDCSGAVRSSLGQRSEYVPAGAGSYERNGDPDHTSGTAIHISTVDAHGPRRGAALCRRARSRTRNYFDCSLPGRSPGTDAQRADGACRVMTLYTTQCAARADCGADAERAQERLRAAASRRGSQGAPDEWWRARGDRSLTLFMRSCTHFALLVTFERASAITERQEDGACVVWARLAMQLI